ncbi:MAG: TetR/AcrR family transcriptional regulator [Halieaceae bacterium]|nr:TetR/AcrR family transcriptional regulator [Halieaceae bacterium]
MVTIEARGRRKQSDRTEAMRARLLNATLELISEHGWAGASMQKICAKAGVSRGAQTHHFPTRESLLIASVQEILSRHQQYLEDELSDGEPSQFSLTNFFDFLWDACFNDNLLACWMEAMVAARHDESLKQAARKTDQKSLLAIKETGTRIAQKNQTRPYGIDSKTADIIELTIYLLRGMVVQDGVHAAKGHHERLYRLWLQLIMPIIEG